jgi:hypothetical protein
MKVIAGFGRRDAASPASGLQAFGVRRVPSPSASCNATDRDFGFRPTLGRNGTEPSDILGLVAMQKIVGSSPIIRSENPLETAGFLCP